MPVVGATKGDAAHNCVLRSGLQVGSTSPSTFISLLGKYPKDVQVPEVPLVVMLVPCLVTLCSWKSVRGRFQASLGQVNPDQHQDGGESGAFAGSCCKTLEPL